MASCLQRGCFTPVTPTGFCSFRSCFYSGPLLDNTLFRGCAALFCTDYRGRQMPSSGLLEGLTLFAENTGLIVGRTLVDPSRWKVPVLVSNFSQNTVVVAPFSEVGMIAQVSAIQSFTEPLHRPQGDADSLPAHLHHLLDQVSRDLDTAQQRRLADVLLQYSDLFPTQGRLQWNMKLTPVIVRPYAVRLVGCPLRR